MCRRTDITARVKDVKDRRTPPDDGKRSPTKPRGVWAAFLAVAALIVALQPQELGGFKAWALVCVVIAALTVGLYLTYVLCVLVHELGHFLFGTVCGTRMRELVAGPVKINRLGRSVKVAVDSMRMNALGGHYWSVGPARGRKTAMLVEIAGGPFLTLGLLAASLCLCFGKVPGWWAGMRWLGVYGAIINGGMLERSLRRSPNYRNDLSLFLWVLKHPDWAGQTALDEVQTVWKDGSRAKDWPRPAIARACDSSDPRISVVGLVLSYYWLLDTGDPTGAATDLETAVTKSEASEEAWVPWEEVAFSRGFIRGDLAGAEEAMARVDRESNASIGQRERALAALAWLRGDREGIEEHCDHAAQWLQSGENPDAANVIAETEWLDALKSTPCPA